MDDDDDDVTKEVHNPDGQTAAGAGAGAGVGVGAGVGAGRGGLPWVGVPRRGRA